MKVRILAAMAALALGTATGGAAHAATYLLTVQDTSCGCIPAGQTDVGTITVVQDAVNTGQLDFTIALNGVLFNANGNSQHHAFAFDLNSGGASLAGLKYINMSTGFQGQTGSTYSDAPFGSSWSNVVDYTGSAKQGSTPSTLSFGVSDTLNNLSLSMLTFASSFSGKNIEFAADVSNGGKTGNVGAVYQTVATGGGGAAVPEPASWALMITGVFAVGAMMRLQRSRARATA